MCILHWQLAVSSKWSMHTQYTFYYDFPRWAAVQRNTENISRVGHACHTGGLVVWYVPATDETRVRFPASVLTLVQTCFSTLQKTFWALHFTIYCCAEGGGFPTVIVAGNRWTFYMYGRPRSFYLPDLSEMKSWARLFDAVRCKTVFDASIPSLPGDR